MSTDFIDGATKALLRIKQLLNNPKLTKEDIRKEVIKMLKKIEDGQVDDFMWRLNQLGLGT